MNNKHLLDNKYIYFKTVSNLANRFYHFVSVFGRNSEEYKHETYSKRI